MSKSHILLFAILLTCAQLNAQTDGVSIGINAPDATAVLHVQPPAKNKGLLIPRLTSTERGTIASPAQGLLVFDLTLNEFTFFDGASWKTLNAIPRTTGASQVTGPVNVNGAVIATDYGLNATGNGPVPKGGIIMWSGLLSAIPTGWTLCDGTSGTPDLRERFIVGAGLSDNATVAGNSYSAGSVGGANTVALTVNEMPSHNHSITDPGHSHPDRWLNSFSGGFTGYGGSTGSNGLLYTSNSTTGVTINLTGGGTAHENRPPYYALAFIMKL